MVEGNEPDVIKKLPVISMQVKLAARAPIVVGMNSYKGVWRVHHHTHLLSTVFMLGA